MRVPGFILEMGVPAMRARLRTGVWTGYLTCLAFLVLAVLADRLGILLLRPVLLVPIAVKLATNTAAWLALRYERGALAASTVNVAADMFAMTAAIYFTGGELSPLFPIYLIEITVIALLGNVGLTMLCAAVAIAMYGVMSLLVHAGVLPPWPPPVMIAHGLTARYVTVDVAYAAIVLGVPAYYAARILKDLRHKQEALELRTRQLVEAGRQKSQFMANVTHELRTPIHGICGLSDLVESEIYGPVTPKQRDAQQSIRRSARALLALIDDLLALARGDAGKAELVPEPVDVSELLTAVVAAARWMVGTKALSVEKEIEPDLPGAQTDPRALRQVVLNLLSNAAKFTPEGGRIVVRARREGAAIRIAVEDSGIGIAPQDQERIFEEFRQLDGSAERAYGGVGLGLAVVRRLVGAMGATVHVESTPSAGSTFAVVLPVAWQAPEAGRPAA